MFGHKAADIWSCLSGDSENAVRKEGIEQYWPKPTSKSWPECSKSEQKLGFMTKPQLSNLQQTVANTILVTNTSNSINLEFGVGIFTRQGHINQVY